MANVKISGLPAATSVTAGTDVAPLVSGGITTKATPQQIVNAGLAAPGAIGGTTRGTAAFTTELVGPSASANFTRFPNALTVISNTSAGIQQNETHNMGIMAEGTANASDTSIYGVGVYGVGYTASGTRCGGVIGEGHVSASADTGSAIGVRGYANDTHAGGLNIGLYGDCANGSSNYALYLNNGDIYTAGAKTWTLNGNLTFSGAYTVTVPTLSVSTTVSGTGFTTYLASPPAIGTTAPAAGKFTDLTSTGNTTIGDASTDTFTVYPQTISLINSTAITAASTKTLTLNGGAGSNGLVIDSSNRTILGGSASVGNSKLTVVKTEADEAISAFRHTSNTSPYGITVAFTAAAPNNTTNFSYQASDNVTSCFTIWSNGTTSGRSDSRLKTNITPAGNQLADILSLEVVNYEWKESINGCKEIGFIAQQVQQVKPGLVIEDKNGYLHIKQNPMIPILVKAIQELATRIEALEAK